MKILQFKAQNIKRLVVVEITPDGHIVQITGKNGAGKSSVLDAIWWALAGADHIQKQPIRAGEDKAYIRLDMGELVVERTFTAKGSYLRVMNADGLAFMSPQKVLDNLVGALSFDPLAFMRMRPADQIAQLQKLAKVDGNVVAEANRADYVIRRDLNRDAKTARARAEAITVPPDTPDAQVDLSELRDRIGSETKINAEIMEAQRNRADLAGRIKSGTALIAKLQAQHDALEEMATTDLYAVGDLEMEFDGATATNEAVRQKRERDNNIAAAEKHEATAAELTEAMETRTKAFEAQMAKAELPIDGLSIDLELGVMFHGVPLEQAGTAEQTRVSTALAMAANPKIRVLRIQDGSLLDEDSLALISSMADAEDYQIWVEIVESSDKSAVVLVDGQRARDDPEVQESQQSPPR